MDDDKDTSDKIATLLRSARTIAVIGIKDRPTEDAFRVPEYMQQAGYRIIPVNPKFNSVLNEPCHADLTTIGEEVEGAIEIVNLFRASEHISGHIDEILALDPLLRLGDRLGHKRVMVKIALLILLALIVAFLFSCDCVGSHLL